MQLTEKTEEKVNSQAKSAAQNAPAGLGKGVFFAAKKKDDSNSAKCSSNCSSSCK
ncbi:MAG: hypothetical protein K2X81_07605 [Candidatus Obscuribacterales bacterium]|nr:hypothetical protein [Candidatus Obscuribacterales bacterium]